MIQFHSRLLYNHRGHLIYEGTKVVHVPQQIHAELTSFSPNRGMQGVELLSSSDSADCAMTTSVIESMQHLGLTGEFWIIGEVVDNDQYLETSACLLGSS